MLCAESGHGGDEYEQIVSDGEILVRLHAIDVEDHHVRLVRVSPAVVTLVHRGPR